MGPRRRLERAAAHLQAAQPQPQPQPAGSDSELSLAQSLMRSSMMGPGAGAALPTRRSPVFGTHGMVSSSQPLATDIGLRVLKAGGNAVDAAIATAAALAVATPAMTGLGGDMFMLFWDAEAKTVRSLNGSGRCASALTAERVRADLGLAPEAAAFPLDQRRHVHAITTPGAAAGWADAVEAWGSGMPLADVLAPAAALAEEGFPVSPMSALMWAEDTPTLTRWAVGGRASELLIADAEAEGGLRAPAAGEVFRNPNLARVLKELGAGGKAAFYTGKSTLPLLHGSAGSR